MAAVYYQIFQAAKRIVDEEMKAQSHLLLTRASSQRLKQQQQQQQQQRQLLPPSIAVDSSATNGHGEGRNQLVNCFFLFILAKMATLKMMKSYSENRF
jgi:hypothetical protein